MSDGGVRTAEKGGSPTETGGEESKPGIRGFVCGGCRQQCGGFPEFIDDETWEPYCSRDCYEFEPEPGCPHVDPGELPCPSCFFDGGRGR